ncbi:unnamed protein product [Cylindrotheca closterium]|uniref:PAS domain-containing protein n=1 Tax=Cylindrotheca closterium TaxID=2856 RepID=A0AAD2JMG7_9STRA|nr:unnamed protein product [Cylindrotheca closterium]
MMNHPQSNHSNLPNSLMSIDESSEMNSDNETQSYEDHLKAQRNLHRHSFHHSRPTSSSTFHTAVQGPAPPRQKQRMSLREQSTDSAYQKNLQSLASALGQRNSILSDATTTTSLWDTVLESVQADATKAQNDHHDDYNHHHHDDHHGDHHGGHGGKVPHYAPPMQRVFYGKPQVLPHVNWGDLFFDLFFVAAAYNLGSLLISSLNDTDWLRGTVYFVGIFGALFQTWYSDLAFSSRYTVLDQVHHLIWGLKFFSVAGAMVFITPISLMADAHSFETIGFIAAILFEALISMGLTIEVYFKAVGDRTPIENHSWRTIQNYHLPTVVMYTTALVLAILAYPKDEDESTYDTTADYYGNSENSTAATYGTRRELAAASDFSCSSGSRLLVVRMLGAAEVECPDDGRRFLAAAAATDDDCSCHTGALLEMRDLPLGIICFTYFFNISFSLMKSMFLASGDQTNIRDRFVPNNLDYVIHRYGEWIMLMIGESVLSLLIVETIESSDYFIIASLGVLNVMCVHTLIFESQPSTSSGHAIFRSFNGQLTFGLLVQVLSMGLIAFGVCFKIMLSTVLAEASSYGRRLAGSVSVSNEMTASLFSISLTVVLISLELMLVTHKGMTETFQRLWKNRDGGSKGINKKIHKPLLALTIAKGGLIIFVATLSQWENELTEISWIGLLVVFGMLASRVIAWGLVHKEDEIRELFSNGLNAMMPKKQKAGHPGPTSLNDIEEANDISMEIATNRDTWDNLDDCVVVCGKGGSIKYANKTALAEFGYTSENNMIGKNIDTVASNHHRENDRRKAFQDIGKLESHRESWDDSMDIVVVIDRKGVIQYANSMTFQEFGYDSEEELVGKDISELVGGGEAMNHGNYMKSMEGGKVPSKVIGHHRASSNKSGKKRLLYAKRKDGTEFPCMIGLKPIGPNYIAGFIKNLSDLSSIPNYNKEEFLTAASEGNVEEVKRLLAHSTSVLSINEGDYDKRTALHLAADYGHEEVIQLLCEAGADANVVDRWGNRPLDDAIRGRHSDCVHLLKKLGAQRGLKPTVSDLIAASAKGATDEVRIILEEGDADMNGCDYDGRTSLHLASCEGHAQVVEVLCEAGSNIDATDRWNRTPLDEAELRGNMACKEKLLHFGAKGKSRSTDSDTDSDSVGLPEVLEETADSIIVSNYDGVIQKLNRTALAAFGYKSDAELVGHNITLLMRDEYAGRKSFGGSPQTQRISHGSHKSGSTFPCIINERKDEHRQLIISYIKDVSDLTMRGSITISSINRQLAS